MKKIQLLGLSVALVFVFSAVITASAFSLGFVAAKWLENGQAITLPIIAQTEGELLFENTLSDSSLLCSVKFIDKISSTGENEMTHVFNLSGSEEIPELDEEGAVDGLKCTGIKDCENNSEVWPVNLPFVAQLDLDSEEAEKYYNLYLENTKDAFPAYFVLCLFLGVNLSELCELTGSNFTELGNTVTDVESIGTTTPLATCNDKLEDGVIETNSGDILLTSIVGNNTLAVSE